MADITLHKTLTNMIKNIVYTKIEKGIDGKFYVKFRPYRSNKMCYDARRYNTEMEAKKRARWLYYNWGDDTKEK